MSKKKLNATQVMSELKGESVFFPKIITPQSTNSPKTEGSSTIEENQTSRVTDLQATIVTKKQSSRHTESQTLELPDLQSYELRNYSKWKRIELRLTAEQRKFLIDLNEALAQSMPEGERRNPNYKRVTPNSIIRVCIEIVRQLEPNIDASQFQNENDLLHSLFNFLVKKLTNLQTTRVTD